MSVIVTASTAEQIGQASIILVDSGSARFSPVRTRRSMFEARQITDMAVRHALSATYIPVFGPGHRPCQLRGRGAQDYLFVR